MIDTIRAVAKKNRLAVKRAYPWSFIWSRVSGAIFSMAVPLMLYYLVFKKMVSDEYLSFAKGSNYITYITLGEVLNVLSFSTLMSVGRCLITEQREGTLDNFILSPASRTGYFVGAYIEQFGRSMMEAFFILTFGVIFGARFSADTIPNIFLCIVLSSIGFFSLSILISTVMLYTRDTYLVQNTIYLLMSCVCGVVFPIEYLPKWVQWLSKFFPLTYALNITRACSNSSFSLHSNGDDLIKIVLLSILFYLVGYFGYIRLEKKLIEDVLA